MFYWPNPPPPPPTPNPPRQMHYLDPQLIIITILLTFNYFLGIVIFVKFVYQVSVATFIKKWVPEKLPSPEPHPHYKTLYSRLFC